MEENDHKPDREIDHFSRFMFGDRFQREADHHSQESEQSSFNSRPNLTDDWLFGNRRNEHRPPSQNQIENILNNVDFMLLMETIEMFGTTTKQLKPLFKEVSPFLNRFIKKFKSNGND